MAGIPPQPTMDPGPSPEERNWAMLAHLSGLATFAFPLGNIIGPVLIWQIKKDLGDFVTENAREAVNFQFTFIIAVCFCISLYFVPYVGVLGLMLMPAFLLAQVFFCVAAAIQTNRGIVYRYPFVVRIFR
jgi:hypothetical protein